MRPALLSVFILISLPSSGQDTTLTGLWKLYNSQNLKPVIEKVKPLLEQDPVNIDLNLLMGRSLADLSDYKGALPYLESTVKYDTYNAWQKAWAFHYLGTCYFMLDEPVLSDSLFRECIKMNATRNVTNEAYGKTLLFGFADFYKDWKTVETEHFRFHFQNMGTEDIEKYSAAREDAYQRINSFFESRLPKKTDFLVWASREDAMQILKANLGFARPNFCLIHTHYQQTIGHEMTHVISYYTAESIIRTRFINEGTAVCFDLSDHDRLKLVKDWMAANHMQIAIRDIWQNDKKYGDEILYPLAGLFVKELIDSFGREKFLEFFKDQTYEHAGVVFGEKLETVIADFESRINA